MACPLPWEGLGLEDDRNPRPRPPKATSMQHQGWRRGQAARPEQQGCGRMRSSGKRRHPHFGPPAEAAARPFPNPPNSLMKRRVGVAAL